MQSHVNNVIQRVNIQRVNIQRVNSQRGADKSNVCAQ
jgi:hypothetical protein